MTSTLVAPRMSADSHSIRQPFPEVPCSPPGSAAPIPQRPSDTGRQQVVEATASLSVDGCYRWTLTRRWAPGPAMTWIMLNPSRADATTDDPTLRRVIGFARAAGFGQLTVVNLYGWRSPSPNVLRQVPDPVGARNDQAILAAVAGADLVVAAWGTHAAGNLPAERAGRLAALPGWYWRLDDAEFDDTYALLTALAADRGSLTENPVAPSVFDGLYTAPPRKEILGIWLARQRQAYRAGLLDPARAELLEALPGWTWTPVDVDDLDHVMALRRFVDAHGHADVPTDHTERGLRTGQGLQLGRWVWDVRRRKLTGRLHPALEAEIWAATPSKWVKGAGRRWNWQKGGVQWRVAYTALRCFADREGHAQPPATHSENLPDITIAVGQWVTLQRHLYRKGDLDQQRVAALERLPGWSWEGNVGGAKPFTDPIDLPEGLEHGCAGRDRPRLRLPDLHDGAPH